MPVAFAQARAVDVRPPGKRRLMETESAGGFGLSTPFGLFFLLLFGNAIFINLQAENLRSASMIAGLYHNDARMKNQG